MRGTDAPRVSSCQDSELAQRRLLADTIDFAAGQPGPGLLASALGHIATASAHRLASEGADPFLLQYGPEQGYASFRGALAAFLTEETGEAVEPEELLITAGVSHGLDLACRHLGASGQGTILVEQPTYFLAGAIIRQSGLRMVPVPLASGGALDLDAVEAALAGGGAPGGQQAGAGQRHGPSLAYLIPVHNNPTAATLPLAARRRLLALAHEHDVTLIADEVYQLLSFPGSPPPPPPLRALERQMLAEGALGGSSSGSGSGSGSSASRVVSLGSFSKIMAPGLRLGWIEASPELLARVRCDGVLGSGGSIAPLASGVAHSCLQLGVLQRNLHGLIRPTLAANCAALCEALRTHLPQACFRQPAGGYFVWLEFERGKVCTQELLRLAGRRFGVRFAPGQLADGEPHCLRLSFAFYTPFELVEGVRRLAAALAAYEAGER